ncbi:MAG: hypothetical protein ACYDBH_22525, partial [Acidobacteriaceae bacterium]
MKEMTVNADAFDLAAQAVLDVPTISLLRRVFDAVDIAERRGHSAGFEAGVNSQVGTVEDARDIGYEQGYDVGYEQARRDLGECPMVDPEFDED